jgi:hypothetical protein
LQPFSVFSGATSGLPRKRNLNPAGPPDKPTCDQTAFTSFSARATTEASGVQFAIHDLRQTFITITESLGIPAYALKRLLNHASGADVTAGYIVASTATERLREPMQKMEVG